MATWWWVASQWKKHIITVFRRNGSAGGQSESCPARSWGSAVCRNPCLGPPALLSLTSAFGNQPLLPWLVNNMIRYLHPLRLQLADSEGISGVTTIVFILNRLTLTIMIFHSVIFRNCNIWHVSMHCRSCLSVCTKQCTGVMKLILLSW